MKTTNTTKPLPHELTENGIHYTLHGDYYLPDIAIEPKDTRPINRWGRMHEVYLKKFHPGLYTRMLLDGTLHTALADISARAEARRKLLILHMQMRENVDEALKARDQMAWVGCMNNIANRADEIILTELIYT